MQRFSTWVVIFLFGLCPAPSQPNRPQYFFKGDNNYPPYEFLDETGNPAGFNVDILRAVCDAMRIPVKVELDAWNRVRHDLETGNIDGITGMFYSKTRGEHVSFSVPFIIVSHSIFVRDDSPIEHIKNIRNKQILVQEGDIMHDFVRQNNLTYQIFPVENQQKALKYLSAGQGDAAILARLHGLYYVQKLALKNLKTVGPTIEPTAYCIAVQKGNDVLLSQINEGLNIIKQNGTYEKIHQKWFGIYQEQTLFEELKYFIWGFIFVFVFLFIGFIWNVSLKIQVARRTRELHREIGERIEVEKALRSSEEKYRYLFQNSNDAIYLLYREKFEIINEKFKNMFQISLEEVQRDDFSFMLLVAGKSKKLILERQEKLLRGEEIPLKYEFTALSTDGKEIEVEASVSYLQYKEGIATQGILRDITARRKMEAELHQVQTLDAIGTLAGGIAHDFNNLLTAVIGHAEIILSQLETWNPIYDDVLAIKAAGKRAEDLTRKILAFSRKQIYMPKIINLNHTFQEFERILRRLIPEEILLKFELHPIPNIKADPGQIEHILMNLIVNARDAIQAKNFLNAEKEIVIETNLAPMDDFFLANHAKSGTGEWVIFSVRDNGIGIDSTVQAKIFEPFFTTKEVGKGTGLGLSTVYGIVQQNKGYVDVQSEKNSGAVFKIYWPASGEQPKPKPAPENTEIPRGNATIFLVEDDENIREFTVSALKKMGYLVFEAKNGKDAWEMLTAKPFKFNLLITDLSMPYMNGKELARQVETLLPDVVVLYMSGYADDQIFQNDILDNSANFIQKPFSMHVLSNRIHDLLREKQK